MRNTKFHNESIGYYSFLIRGEIGKKRLAKYYPEKLLRLIQMKS